MEDLSYSDVKAISNYMGLGVSGTKEELLVKIRETADHGRRGSIPLSHYEGKARFELPTSPTPVELKITLKPVEHTLPIEHESSSSLTYSAPAELSKTARVRKEVPAEERCMARIWGSAANGNLGMGPQCTAKKCGPQSDYCKMHAKMAAESGKPLQWRDGRKFGLFMGRIDEPLRGKDDDGKWQILWRTPEILAQIEADKAAGTFELGEALAPSRRSKTTKLEAKKAKVPKVPKPARGKNSYMFYLESRRADIEARILATANAVGASDEDKAKVALSGKVKVAEVTRIAGAEWRAISAEEKAPFEELAAVDKAEKLKAFEDELGKDSV